MPYFQRVILFGDGAKGTATQVYSIQWGDGVSGDAIDTGIIKTWSRKDRNDPGTTTFQRGEQIGTAKELVDAWAKENGKEPLA